MSKLKLIVALFLLGSIPAIAQKSYQLQSPDGKLKAEIAVEKKVAFSLSHDGTEVLASSPISMTLGDGTVLGNSPKVVKAVTGKADETIESPFYKKTSVKNNYNELSLVFKGDFAVVFRAFDDGFAYRFITHKKGDIVIKSEQADFNFSADHPTWIPYSRPNGQGVDKRFMTSFENTYAKETLAKFDKNNIAFLPVLVGLDNGKKLCITEADLEDFPGLFLGNPNGKTSLEAVHAPYPKTVEQGGHNMLQGVVKEYENFIAKTRGDRDFPWRVFVVSTDDKELTNSDMVYCLASPNRLSDISWIKPGKVAWDWWNDWNLYGVPFKAGINNETYKYYIDFAAKNHIEYIILDEGWAVNKKADLMQIIPEINLEELVKYGKEKNVGIVLWAGYYAFNRDMENVVRHYSEMGIKGFKIDFMDRDDQEIVDFFYRAAETCAKYKMLCDFHGAYKPTGLLRTYPNVLNSEGVNGLEQMKWQPETYDQVTYDVSIPFIRMLAGPLDYTQGAMRNAIKKNYRPINSEPMSQGTRTHQLAEYIIFESPFSMLCDNPCNYEREKDCTDFIASVPTTWDETIALTGEVGEYIAIARRKGDTWYIGALNNWTSRTVQINIAPLGKIENQLQIFCDGANSERVASDYKKTVMYYPLNKVLPVHMASGGGFVGVVKSLKPVKK